MRRLDCAISVEGGQDIGQLISIFCFLLAFQAQRGWIFAWKSASPILHACASAKAPNGGPRMMERGGLTFKPSAGD
jgi:hypothetical protein